MRFASTQGLNKPTGLQKPDAINSEGHEAFSETVQSMVSRCALTGVLKDSYYTDEAVQTKELVEVCRHAAQECPEFLLDAAVVSRKANFKLFPKLAIAALVSTLEPEGSKAPGAQWTPALENTVVDILKTYSAGQLLELALVFKGKTFTGGLGRRAQRVIGRALASMSTKRLEDITLSDRDDLNRLLRLTHPAGIEPEKARLLGYALGEKREAVSERQMALEALKMELEDDKAAYLINSAFLPFNATKGIVSGDRKAVWSAILGEMSPLQVLINLKALDEKGVVTPQSVDTFFKAQDLDKLRLVPHDILRPIANAPDKFREPLVSFLSRMASRPLPGLEGKRVGVLLDISPSMADAYGKGSGPNPANSCWYLAATMATPIMASCPDRTLVFFDNLPHAEGGVVTGRGFGYGDMKLPYLKGCPSEAILHNLLPVNVRQTNGTDIGLAIDYFVKEKIPVDVLFLFTDEQQNGSIRGIDRWRAYLRSVNAQARLVVVNVSNNKWHMAVDGKDRVTIIQSITPLIYQQLARFDESPVDMILRLGSAPQA
jgi:hypothetical protein